MKVLIISDSRIRVADGRNYLVAQIHYIIKRYREAFGELEIFTRVVPGVPDQVNFFDLDDCVGKVWPRKPIWQIRKNKAALREAIAGCDLVVARLGSISAIMAHKEIKRQKKPLFIEMMNDPWDALWNHSLKGKLVAPFVYWATKPIVKNADFAVYVTREFLQKRYPCKNESVGVSDVVIDDLTDDVLEKRLAKIARTDASRELVLATTAAVNVRYKGQEYVIRAIPKLNKLGIRVKYVMIGGGDPSYLTNVARKCGVLDQVEFAGRRPREEVFQILDSADVYMQPSLQEGLPRSVVEAMSRALPCVGARTAGIPELIRPECVVGRKSVDDIVEAVKNWSSQEKLAELAKENFARAKEFQNDVLTAQRNEYYARVIRKVEEMKAGESKREGR